MVTIHHTHASKYKQNNDRAFLKEKKSAFYSILEKNFKNFSVFFREFYFFK